MWLGELRKIFTPENASYSPNSLDPAHQTTLYTQPPPKPDLSAKPHLSASRLQGSPTGAAKRDECPFADGRTSDDS